MINAFLCSGSVFSLFSLDDDFPLTFSLSKCLLVNRLEKRAKIKAQIRKKREIKEKWEANTKK